MSVSNSLRQSLHLVLSGLVQCWRIRTQTVIHHHMIVLVTILVSLYKFFCGLDDGVLVVVCRWECRYSWIDMCLSVELLNINNL